MEFYKTKLIFSSIGGLLLVSVYFLSTKLFYLTGLLIPVFYIITILSSMFYAKTKESISVDFIKLLRTNFTVFIGMSVINFLFMIINKSLQGNSVDNLLAFGVLIIFGLSLSLLLAYIFKIFFLKKKQ